MKNLLKIFQSIWKKKSHVKYTCPKCKTHEMIPLDVIEYFDAIDPERMLYGPPSFRCEQCGYEYMMPARYKSQSLGHGLYKFRTFKG